VETKKLIGFVFVVAAIAIGLRQSILIFGSGEPWSSADTLVLMLLYLVIGAIAMSWPSKDDDDDDDEGGKHKYA